MRAVWAVTSIHWSTGFLTAAKMSLAAPTMDDRCALSASLPSGVGRASKSATAVASLSRARRSSSWPARAPGSDMFSVCQAERHLCTGQQTMLNEACFLSVWFPAYLKRVVVYIYMCLCP